MKIFKRSKKDKVSKRLLFSIIFVFAVVVGVSTFLIIQGVQKAEAERIEAERIVEEKRLEEERLKAEEEARKKEEETSEESTEETSEETSTNSSSNSNSNSSSMNGGNCTTSFGNLMLINPNFTVSTSWIASRKTQLISVSKTYGISEAKASNGDNLMDAEAAKHLGEMVKAYEAYNSGHTMQTRSCFRQVGTTCGRLCAKTGTSDHHTGLTCDLIDSTYGTDLNTDDYSKHKEWQWLKANSYKYGFIDRFPEAWAGGSMSEPINVDANGSTGLFETWHYRYVGVTVATEIATGKYNNGKYDSLEHYLKSIKKVSDLKNGKC
ncbi:D-alanyl-D-alanine carboxypeptidase family protein [Candidatus Saccharibacteria bacterium]|nr:D-alanyl-D-alanine carboxypeptidase family protein [Candidatus Saccharibacteria bacterium]